MLNCREEVLQLTKQLVGVASVVGTPGEPVLAHWIYGYLAQLPYFQRNPGHLRLQRTESDDRERYNVIALVKGEKKPSAQTVLMLGHLDTVGTEDFGVLQPFAHSHDELVDHLEEWDLNPEEIADLRSGRWLLGRGALDMKAGLASQIYIIKAMAAQAEELEGNLALLAECDEEDMSHGVLSALPLLATIAEDHGLEYQAAINADYTSPRYPGDDGRYLYLGTVGKLLPAFYVTGKETHVGQPFEGLDPNLIVAELTRRLSYNPDLCDVAYGETTLPPVSLKQADFKDVYTVQTPLAAHAYFNFFIHSWSPAKVLELMREQAHQAFADTLAQLNERHRSYCELAHAPYHPLPWLPRVLTYEELYQELANHHGQQFTEAMEEKARELIMNEVDLRDFCTALVEEGWRWSTNREPAIIVYYGSVYYPRIEITGQNQAEERLLEAVNSALSQVKLDPAHPIRLRKFYPYISDVSFLSVSDDPAAIEAYTANFPAWGIKHYVDFNLISQLNLPVVNIGPYGFDAHKRLERLDIDYSCQVVPNLILSTVERLLNG
ncbi:MAG: M20/M25/M40 family metallo-hydrolase [Bacillota bacterium]